MGGGNLEGKIHLVKWEVVCTNKNKGGLGLRKLALLNKALLGKWIWRYACDKDNLWKQVITTKYGQEVLDGGQRRLMGRLENVTVEEMWDQNSGQGGWNLKFLRTLMIGSWIWLGFAPCFEGFIWVDRVPTKVAFFAWEATWGKVLTLDRLQIRGLQLPNCCFLCGCEEENVNHILIHCIVVRALWDIVLGWSGFGILPKSDTGFFVFLVYSSNQIHPNVRQSVISSFPHYGHSGIVEAARDLFNQVEGNAGAGVPMLSALKIILLRMLATNVKKEGERGSLSQPYQGLRLPLCSTVDGNGEGGKG
ncbi:hypothetical protein CK203_032432 [Vitis vinifera]|uniref:Reverse transcriptase zinc-binding domain-containing protein n=1 Tax=Vitis vinifera TaxID=29760 RepID=A0A438I6L9_VITVI|nr:hypothetical protein CK203_032432 [Vitis vinifera]